LCLHLYGSTLLRKTLTVNHYLRIEYFQQGAACSGDKRQEEERRRQEEPSAEKEWLGGVGKKARSGVEGEAGGNWEAAVLPIDLENGNYPILLLYKPHLSFPFPVNTLMHFLQYSSQPSNFKALSQYR